MEDGRDKVSQGSRLPVLALILYPFVWGAVAINLFMLGLLWQEIGLPAISPVHAMLGAIIPGILATWACTRWVKKLIAEAER